MPEEIFIIVIVFIMFVLAPTAVFKGVKSLREGRAPERSGSRDGHAMRRSDLQAMVDDAVIEATAPLAARLDELEHELLVGEGRIAPEVLEEALGEADEFEQASGPRRQRGR